MDNSNANGFPQPRDQVSSLNNYASNGKIMLFSGIILFAAILLVLFFHTYARWLFNLRRRRRHIHSLSASNAAPAPAPQGLDSSVLKALPVLVYSSKIHDTVLECAVCLSEFRDGEEGRVLPACKHTFHSCCIDMWFYSHSNCPLCRATVQDTRSETVIPVMEAVDLRQKEENQRFCSASTPSARLSPLQCQKVTPDLMGILVEVPTTSGEQTLAGGPSVHFGPMPNGKHIGSEL